MPQSRTDNRAEYHVHKELVNPLLRMVLTLVDIILNQVAEIDTERLHDTIPPDAQAAYRKSNGINVPNN